MPGAIAEFEKTELRERTQRGKRAKALAGKVVFNDHAYGYDWDAKKSMYIINEKETDTLKLIYNMYIERQIGVRVLSYELKALCITNQCAVPHLGTVKTKVYCPSNGVRRTDPTSNLLFS